jgi:hypothetical protein
MDPRTDVDRVADGRAGHAGRIDRAEHNPARPRRFNRGAGVDGQRVQPQPRRLPAAGRRARRPVRSPPVVRGRARIVRSHVNGGRVGAGCRVPDRRTGGAGPGRRARDLARPRDRRRRLPARAPRRGDRNPRGRDGPGHHWRTRCRRRRRRGHLLGVDLLGQRPDRAGRSTARTGPHPGEPRARHHARPPRLRGHHRRRLRDRLGPRAATRRAGAAPRSSPPSP